MSVTGSDAGAGTAARPFRTVQRGVDAAVAGDTVAVHAGSYDGVVSITRSGTAAKPITVTAAGDGEVTLTSSQRPRPCDAHTPTYARTIQVGNGADYWTFRNLRIVNGAVVKGVNGTAAIRYLAHLVAIGDWATRRKVPGRGSYDPVAAKGAFAYISARTGTPIDPSDGIRFVGNDVSGRGLQIVAARYGEVSGNRIHDIDCGTGPGLWLNVYSDGWLVAGNSVSAIAESTFKHYMQEGIRLGSASAYNTVRDNTVAHLPGDGRAVNTDVDASWNLFTHNTADDVAIGYNDQQSGWGNRWEYNTATNFRVWGLNFRGLDSSLLQPSLTSSTYLSVVRCNIARGGPTDPVLGGGIRIGAAKKSSFDSNYVDSVVLGDYESGVHYVRDYWASQGNTWNGRPVPPPLHPRLPPPGACS